jgi:hypothetical protein
MPDPDRFVWKEGDVKVLHDPYADPNTPRRKPRKKFKINRRKPRKP